MKDTGLPARGPGHRAGQSGLPDRAWRPWADGLAAAATGLALIGAPTYGTSTSQAFSGMPQNPTVWYDDGDNYNQLGEQGQGYSGEIDWNETPGSGAAYLVAFLNPHQLLRWPAPARATARVACHAAG